MGREVSDCKGWNFHVYSLGADRCSICGQSRYDRPHDEDIWLGQKGEVRDATES